MSKCDIVVIGSGPGGYAAAIRAAQLGAKVNVIEKSTLGGTCLNRGCIPTKAMIKSTALWKELQTCDKFGIELGDKKFDHAKMMERCYKVVGQLRGGVAMLFKRHKIDLIEGSGKIVAKGKVEVTSDSGTQTIECDKIIIATGSEPFELPGMEFGGNILSSTDILQLTETPKSLIVVGAGAVGVEFASIFSNIGAEVTVVEMVDQLVPTEDKQIAAVLEKNFKERGIKTYTGTKVTKTENTKTGVKCELDNGETIQAEKMLVAVGRKLNTENIGLENVGIATERGAIEVDNYMETSVAGIYAIGDITNKLMLAHVAHHQAVVAAENATGGDSKIDYRVVPGCIYSEPEIASVGINQRQAEEQGLAIKVSRFPFAAVGKALIVDETEGFVQLVTDKSTTEILGIQIVGIDAPNLIGEAVVLIGLEATAFDLAHLIHPHPTLTEAVMEAGLASLGHAIHI
jgi:dihydrolipoyl dehydrogenase